MLSRPDPTVWVEVEDLFEYFIVNTRPSGIQRLAFEIMRELVAIGAPVRFVRHRTGGGLLEVSWDSVVALFSGSVAGPPRSASPAAPLAAPASRPTLRHAVWRALPPPQRHHLRRAVVLQKESLRNVRLLLHLLRRRRPAVAAGRVPVPPAPAGPPAPVQPGDRFLLLGAPWAVAGFPERLRAIKQRHGVSVTLLTYDLIPVRHPEWCTRQLTAAFTAWLRGTLPLCDVVLAISRHTADDVEAYAREEGIALPGPVSVIPVGTGFSDAAARFPDAARPRGLPRPGSYVLFVSTLERRKNHVLLFRVWRHLLEEVRAGRRSASTVPDLVFAGRIGWMVSDLLAQLDNTAWLNGRIRLVREPTDDELRALYDGALFTVLPSLHEGWGLSLTESLAAGKPCLAAATSALPEAGGSLCRYFDPEDTGSALRAVTALLDEPGAIDAWTNDVRRTFRPTPWADVAQAVLRKVVGVS